LAKANLNIQGLSISGELNVDAYSKAETDEIIANNGILSAEELNQKLEEATNSANSYADTNFVSSSQKAVANGVASLDAAIKIPVSQIPDVSGTHTHNFLGGLINGRRELAKPDSNISYGDYVINSSNPLNDWAGITFFQPWNPKGSQAAFLVNNSLNGNLYANFQGVINPSIGWSWYFQDGQLFCKGITPTSDLRLKKDFEPTHDVLDGLNQLETFKFRWKDGADDAPLIFGVSAQQVRQLMPEAVTETINLVEGEPILGVDYNQVVVVLLKGIQELSVKVKALEESVKILQK
jgi:hypothetical protein